ncbi:3-hydroxybutyrate dehydrogenase [Pseudoalteromonas piscicida]|uniref:3-hydroxybutyrate dehydrogenase n=1 Tax=Pseudoalteromonas piscicida TaxID=43662 RepID=UPI0030AD94A4
MTTAKQLSGKTALITGSTSGIGLATAHVLAQHGANIVLHGLVADEEGQAMAKEFESSYGIQAMFDGANLAQPEAISALMDSAIRTMGAVDILVNNAGIQHTETLEAFPEEKWQAIIAINLSAVFFTMQKAIPTMKQKGWGRIINVASVHGLVASLKKSAYCAAKHGVVGVTKVAALENAEYGITANSICPGWVDTPLISAQIQDFADKQGIEYAQAKRDLVTTKQAIPDMAQPNQIGELILFLCTDAARNISGASLPIDGAWTAQ